MSRLAKNEAIRAAGKATRERRKSQVCKTYELKVDRSRLNLKSQVQLRRLFLEAKWFYNDLLARGDVWNADYKRTEVTVKNKDGLFEARKLEYLSSHMRQGITEWVRIGIVALSRLKKKGHKVGKLRFKSRVKSIPLKQFKCTYRIEGDDRIHIQGLKQALKVRGLGQIPKGAEMTSATLEQRQGDYFIHITTFQPKERKESLHGSLGVDFGIKRQLTLSNGLAIQEGVPIPKRIRRIYRELSRRKSKGENYRKTLLRLNKEYAWITNQRKDIRNKIVSRLVSRYETIRIQDDCVKGWQAMWGRRIEASAIGGIMSALKERAHTLVIVPTFVATTKPCSRCGTVREVSLKERVYQCHRCGLSIDRDLNSAINIERGIPTERRELTPVDTRAATELMEYFNSIPGVSACLVVETGSAPSRAQFTRGMN
jgi:transposase